MRLALVAADTEERRDSGPPTAPHVAPEPVPQPQPQPQPEPEQEPALSALAVAGQILRLDGSCVATTELEGKLVALDFSGHWCPPGRSLTPLLKYFYVEAADLEQVRFVAAAVFKNNSKKRI